MIIVFKPGVGVLHK